jgi:anti-sigma regulatory factor (Ser/Thr protein kinase)
VVLLPHTPSSVAVARRGLAADLVTAGVLGSAVADATVVVSELLSNAVRHAEPLPGSTVRVAWRLDSGTVHVAVSDGGGMSAPRVARPRPGTPGGRGLGIVQSLSSRWGIRRDDNGVTVWAVLPAPHPNGTAPDGPRPREAARHGTGARAGTVA